MTTPAKASKAKKKPVKVEKVKNPSLEVEPQDDSLLFVVKLDSKRYEARTMEQVLLLVEGSSGVVSKITIERH